MPRSFFIFLPGLVSFYVFIFPTTYVPMLRIPEVPTMCRSVWHMHLSCQTVPELPGHARLAIAGVRTGSEFRGSLAPVHVHLPTTMDTRRCLNLPDVFIDHHALSVHIEPTG